MAGRWRYKRKYRILTVLAACAGILAGWGQDGLTGGSTAGEACLQQTEGEIREADTETVLLGGMPVGIYMETDGVMVLDTQKIEGTDGEAHEPAAGLVRAGDYIMAVNNQEISGKAELLAAMEKLDEENVVLTVRRGSETMDVRIRPVECAAGGYRLGIWVRDNVQGLGTVTFLTGDGRFGALGHGIHDTDTNVLMDIDRGRVYRTSIQNIRKGTDGNPGSMEGIIVYNDYNILGSIDKNTEAGIYGTIDGIDRLFQEQIPVETAKKEEIVTGPASVRCYVDGEIGEYEIQVTEIDMSADAVNKGLVIQVTDPVLLEKTGGIIQGMSGSPIIQNGKLIGAVTHVFVQDSTKGYGIFIENMLKEAESSDLSKNMSN
ncbi:MAG TPA: SpoIVB peptidase [Candidatus Mediterraneibacter cottocaccae]|nr:SpoIVB peptidase [Candidatus Mediterraneibacter cottocaccae]